MNQDDTKERYFLTLLAIKSGISERAKYDPGTVDPENLLLSIAAILCDHAALVRLLIRRGIILTDEYFEAALEEVEKEKRRYEDELSNHYGTTVRLS